MAGDTQPPNAGPAMPPLSLEDVAKLFPQLEIIRLVGTGGMGAVYQARQPALDRLVALKLLHTPPANDPGFAERFAQEARALAKLNHPNIVALYESGQAGGRPYFLMEFVDGVNLRQLQQAGRLSPREALQIVPQVCDALQYAHDEGIVHRDIKPENVLIDRKGRVKVADFGLAKLMGRETAAARLTGAGNVMGTPHYMAPEQVEHPLEVDHRADIFSLGVVFYELLTGELPLGKFPMPSKKVRIDVRLDEVVLKALEKEPALRYGQASELKTRVEMIAETPAMAGPPVVETGKTKHMRGQILTGSLSLVLMAVGMAINITPFQPYGLGILIFGILLSCTAIVVALTAKNSPVKLRVARDVMLINGIGLLSAVIPLALDCPWMLQTHSHVLVIAACGIGIVAGVLKMFNAWPFEAWSETIAKGPSSGEKSAFGGEVRPDMRGLAYVALGCLIAGLVVTPTMVALSQETVALCFGPVFGLMALVFGIEARSERLGRRVAWATAAILVAFGLTIGVWMVVRRSQTAQNMALLKRAAEERPGQMDGGAPASQFGAVVERLVGDVATHQAPELIKLGTGEVVFQKDILGSLEGLDVKKGADVFRARGIDATGTLEPNIRGLAGWECVALPMSASAWADLSPVMLGDMLEGSQAGSPVVMAGTGRLPATYAIKTRTGRVGLLQILGFSEKPRGVNIRYKLVKPDSALADASMQKQLAEIELEEAVAHTRYAEGHPTMVKLRAERQALEHEPGIRGQAYKGELQREVSKCGSSFLRLNLLTRSAFLWV
ncbi:MAG: serine/threonine-protein kinase [Opitutaceae bacterium]